MKRITEYIIITAILIFLSGCKTNTVYVPVETVRTEYQDKFRRDSIYLQDSIFVKLRGDTVYYEKYKYIYRDKLIRDSIFVTDSIQVPYPVQGGTEYVNHLYWWQYLLMGLGIFTIGFISYKIYSFIRF